MNFNHFFCVNINLFNKYKSNKQKKLTTIDFLKLNCGLKVNGHVTKFLEYKGTYTQFLLEPARYDFLHVEKEPNLMMLTIS